MKRRLLRLLARLGLLRPTYRAYERLRALRGERAAGVPPAQLRMRVAGTTDVAWFLEGGRLGAETVRETAARHGRPVDELESLLDFGCGCGRVLRYWRDLPAAVHGSDADADAVAWCRRNLDFAQVAPNAAEPPLAHADESFDLVYAFSVFTHLPEELQRPWLAEFRRVLRPGGLLLLSTHGESYLDRLTPPERERFAAGEVVVRWEQAAGTNLCNAYQQRGTLEQLADGLAVVEFVAEGAKGNPHQDLSVLRKD